MHQMFWWSNRKSSPVGYWVVVLFGLWSLGGVSSIVLVLRQQRLAKRLIENGTPFVGREFLGQYRTLCWSMGLVKPPRVVTSNDLVSPMLIRIWKPTILLPNVVVEKCMQRLLLNESAIRRATSARIQLLSAAAKKLSNQAYL